MKRIFGNWWFLTGLAVLCLVLVFCLGLPIFVGGLRPWWVRIALFVLFAGSWLLLGFLRARRVRKAAEAIEKELATPSAADEESVTVAARMGEALAQLKSSSGGKGDYLYNRPWYVIIGPPGAGKTTALLNSGLRFPLADQSFRGVGGTRNLDFWFADEAAFVDTAGRYTTQDSDSSADSQGWKSFLSLLKKHRPRSPVNGVIVALGVDELLRSDRAGLDRHAALVRRRLAEIRAGLEVSFPVYLLLTKADLLSGFVEYYDDLDVEGRRAVLGATLPTAIAKPKADDFAAAFDRVVIAQGERQAKRLYEEVDAARRSLLLGFPAQLGALRNRLTRFIDGAFLSGDQPVGNLRGFYLTSGVQEGAPLDRILSGVADVFQAQPSQRGASGRTYFLNRLLTDVVFGEAGLVQADPAARRREAARNRFGYIAIAASAVLVLVAWGYSFIQNRTFLANLADAANETSALSQQTGIDLTEVRDTDPSLEQSLSVLRALRDLPQGYAQQEAGGPGIGIRFGLFQSWEARRAREAYLMGLRRILLPRILLRLESHMATHSGDPLAVYQPLKVYLMLGGKGPMDNGTVKSWVTADWAQGDQLSGADRAPTRKELGQHLDAMLADTVTWPGGTATPLDGTTIANARAVVQTMGMADRAYAVLRQKAMSGDGPPWRASNYLSAGDVQAFANGEEVFQSEVPYFYTRQGYEKAYVIGLATVEQDLKKDLWVLGDAAQMEGTQMELGQVRGGVATKYAAEYKAAWERIITLPKAANYYADMAAFGSFTRSPSPLKKLLLQVKENTTFSGGSGAAKAMIGEQMSQSRFGRSIDVAKSVSGAGGGFDAGTEIGSYFKALQDFVGGSSADAPIDQWVAAIKQAVAANGAAKSLGGGMGGDALQAQQATAVSNAAAAGAVAPPQLQGFMASVANGGQTAAVDTATGAINDAYKQSVLPACMMATDNKYPFFGKSRDNPTPVNASLVDVQQVFGMGGTIDGFLQQRVMPLLDTSTPVWRWNAGSSVTANLSPSTPDDLFKARQLRDMLMGGLLVKVESKTFGASVDSAELTVGSAQTRFEPGSAGEKQVIWSAQGNVPQAALVLMSRGSKVKEFSATGPWALFRLMDEARFEKRGGTWFATFGTGTATIAFKMTFPTEQNPFARGTVPWSFRCPSAL